MGISWSWGRGRRLGTNSSIGGMGSPRHVGAHRPTLAPGLEEHKYRASGVGINGLQSDPLERWPCHGKVFSRPVDLQLCKPAVDDSEPEFAVIPAVRTDNDTRNRDRPVSDVGLRSRGKDMELQPRCRITHDSNEMDLLKQLFGIGIDGEQVRDERLLVPRGCTPLWSSDPFAPG